MIVAPLLLWALVEAAGARGALGAGIVCSTPLTTPIMSAPALCILFGLDAALALIVTVASYALVPLTLPPLALLLLGIELDVTVIELMWRLGRIVAASFVIAAAARSLAATRRMVEAHASRIDGILVIGMVGVAVSLMSGLPGYAAANPAHTSITTAATFLTNIALQVAAAAAFWRMGRKTAVTVALVDRQHQCRAGLRRRLRECVLRPPGVFRARAVPDLRPAPGRGARLSPRHRRRPGGARGSRLAAVRQRTRGPPPPVAGRRYAPEGARVTTGRRGRGHARP